MGSINFDSIVEDYFEFYNIYLKYLPEELRVDFDSNIKSLFEDRFGCEFKEDIVKGYLNYHNSDLCAFFIYLKESLLEFKHSFVDFDNYDQVMYKFFDFDRFYTIRDHGFKFKKKYNDEIMPSKAVRHNVNRIVSQFCNEVINKKDNVDSRFKDCKKLLLSFLYLSVLTQFNKNYKVTVNGEEKIFTNDVANRITSDGKTLGKKKLNSITDIFAHGSGNFTYDSLNNKLSFLNFNSVSIDIDCDQFISVMDNLFNNVLKGYYISDLFNPSDSELRMYDSFISNKGVMKPLLSIIDNIKNDTYENIKDSDIVLLMAYLTICHNQESLLNNQIMSQYSLIDCSDFYLEYGKPIDFNDIGILNTHDFVFANSKSERDMLADYGDALNTGHEDLTICDTSKMAFDNTNGLFIPTSEVVKHLRNSLRHGRIKIDGDMLYFYDQTNDNDPSTKYFFLEISVDKFKKFLDNNILQEVMRIEFLHSYNNDEAFIDYKNSVDNKKGFFYYCESAYSKNSFANFINICMTHFPNTGIDNFVDNLIENKLISRYLADNPDRFPEFLEYKFNDGRLLIDILSDKFNYDFKFEDDFDYNGSIADKIKLEMYELMKLEKDIENPELSKFFIHFHKHIQTQYLVDADREFADGNLLTEVTDLKNKYIDLINNPVESEAYHKLLLSVGLSKHMELSEVDRINACFGNYMFIRNNFPKKELVEVTYNNLTANDLVSSVDIEVAEDISNKLRRKMFMYRSINKFFNISFIANLGLVGFFINSSFNGFMLPSLYDVGLASSVLISSILAMSKFTKKDELGLDYMEYKRNDILNKIESLKESDEVFQNNVGGIKR